MLDLIDPWHGKLIKYDKLFKDLNNAKSIIVLSNQHTGTWTVIDIIRQCYGISRDQEALNLRDVLFKSFSVTPPLIFSHIAGLEALPNPLEIEKFVKSNISKSVAEDLRTIVPVRDPVLCLLTRNNRHPYLNSEYIIEGFQTMMTFNQNCTFLPVDVSINREDLVSTALQKLNLKHPDIPKLMENWPNENSSGRYSLKDEYLKGNVQAVMEALPKEMELLIKYAKPLESFLRHLGYKDLPWWGIA